jgi:transposase
MSQSLLYHAFGIINYNYVNTKYEEGKIFFTIKHNNFSLCCPDCGSKEIICRGTKNRRFKTLPIGGKLVFIELCVQRIECKKCNAIKQVNIDFTSFHHSYTKSLEHYIIDLSKHMTIEDISKYLKMSWDTVKEIIKCNLEKVYRKTKLKDLKKIAIDEISIGKNHKYLTIVLDLETGKVVYIGDGKSSEALTEFWKKLKHSKAKVEAIAIDMSKAYIKAIKDNVPDTCIVFDHFHVIKLFNEKLSDFRRKLHNKVKDKEQKQVLKGTRWLLLKNPENLNEEYNEKERLEQALKLNKPLSCVYYMKEDLKQIWMQKTKNDAIKVFNDWIKRAKASKIKMLKKFSKLLESYSEGILAYYDYPISTGPLEGVNNKIKTMKRQAYGFRDKQFFMLKIMDLHNTRYALVG